MNPYSVSGKTKILEPLSDDNLDAIFHLIAHEDVKNYSAVYPNGNFNLSLSIDTFRDILYQSQMHKLFLIKPVDSSDVLGIVGLSDIDWIQQNGTLVLLMNRDRLRNKESHEPVKLLLNKALFEWNLRKIIVPVFSDDSATVTMLKSFGFGIEGTLKEYVQFKNEARDVAILGLLKRDFHQVEF